MTKRTYLREATLLKRVSGVKLHRLSDDLSGCAFYEGSIIMAPAGRTADELYIVAHECGHLVLHANTSRSTPAYIVEYEAEIFAHEALGRLGVEVSGAMTTHAKIYVNEKIWAHLKRRPDAKLIPEITEWSGWVK